MIVTCKHCPRQIACRPAQITRMLRAFRWTGHPVIGAGGVRCNSCSEDRGLS